MEAATNKYFPASNSAAEVRDKLVAACRRYGVEFAYGSGLQGMQQQADGSWRLELSDGSSVAAGRVILATGGLSFPKMGTTGDGYRLLERLGHSLHQPYAALTPLKGRHPGGEQLAGVSMYEAELAALPAAADGGGGGGSGGSGTKKGGGKKGKGAATTAQRTAMLFTHRGYSGPAILDLSHHAVRALDRQQPPPHIRVQWTHEGAEAWEQRLLEGGAVLAPNLLRREGLPQRLAEALCAEAGVPLDRWVGGWVVRWVGGWMLLGPKPAEWCSCHCSGTGWGSGGWGQSLLSGAPATAPGGGSGTRFMTGR